MHPTNFASTLRSMHLASRRKRSNPVRSVNSSTRKGAVRFFSFPFFAKKTPFPFLLDAEKTPFPFLLNEGSCVGGHRKSTTH